MPSTFLDIATDSLTAIGQLGQGRSMSPEQAEQCLRVGNRMLGKWSTQRLYLYNVFTRTYALSAGTQDYTIGPGGTLGDPAATRPVLIESAQLTLPGSAQSNPISIYDKPKWDAISDKGAQSSALGLPSGVWPEYTYPTIALHFWPIPSNAAGLSLGVWDQLQQFADIYEEIALPPGYEEAIMWNLALEMCPFYDMPANYSTIQQMAGEGRLAIQKINAQSLGGALADSQTLTSPNVGQPQVDQPAVTQ